MAAASTSSLPDSLVVERRGAVAVIALNRPAKRNALDDATVDGLRLFFATLADDVRAVVLHGAGDHFCAGLDLGAIRELDAAEGMLHSRQWHRAFGEIQFGKAPVVAVLHGAVIGGGLELACAAHIRVAEESAYYALPEGQRGIFVGGGASVRLPRLIGVARMADMMLTGRSYTAAEGVALGFSQYLVKPREGLAKALELADRIAANAPLTNYAVMHALPRIAELGQDQGLLMESLVAAIAQSAPDAKGRLKDFLDKKKLR